MRRIFWTGGFDSTFRLLQLINDNSINELEIFYISLFIDNTHQANNQIESYVFAGRRSIEQELKTMSSILSMIEVSKISKFTIIGKSDTLLLCNLIFNFHFMNYISKEKIEYTDKTERLYLELYKQNIVLRPVCQWGAITQILEELDIEADICIEKGGNFWEKLSSKVQNGKVNFNDDSTLKVFSRYHLPILELTKEEMLETAIKNDWYEILKNTWSCWYPDNGRPCEECFACERRVV